MTTTSAVAQSVSTDFYAELRPAYAEGQAILRASSASRAPVHTVSVSPLAANSETGSLAGYMFTCTCGSTWSTTLSSGHAREIERHEAFHANARSRGAFPGPSAR